MFFFTDATLRRRDKKEYASFLLFFLSHGFIKIFENDYHEIIKTADDDMLISDIWKHFENTETWNNKPKCFFFQTCRGKDLVEGVKVVNRVPNHAGQSYDHPIVEPAPQTSKSDQGFLSGWPGMKKRQNPVYDNDLNCDIFPHDINPHNVYYVSRTVSTYTLSIPFTEPKFSDLLTFHSTYQGASSFRESDYSPFVNAVISNFRKDIFNTDLLSIVQNIQKEIAYIFHASDKAQRDAIEHESSELEGSRQMPIIESTLTGKICYQNPKNIEVATIGCSQELPKHYDMKSGKGRAVIFANNYKLMPMFPPLDYVVSDVNGLKKSFDLLNCETTVNWDLTAAEFLNALNEGK